MTMRAWKWLESVILTVKKRTVQSCKEALNELSNNLNHSNTELQNMAQSIRSSQKDYITILGIFAAVVMVFFSGVGFSSSVLANIHQASIYRIWIGITLLGAVLFNSLWVKIAIAN